MGFVLGGVECAHFLSSDVALWEGEETGELCLVGGFAGDLLVGEAGRLRGGENLFGLGCEGGDGGLEAAGLFTFGSELLL